VEYLKEDQLKKKKKRQKIPMRKKSKRSLATKITPDVRMDVKVRDRNVCIVCGSSSLIELHHLIEKSRLGMGVVNNLMCLCKLHRRQLHDGNAYVKALVRDYMNTLYPEVTDNERKYRKWEK